MLSIEEARRRILARATPLETVEVPLPEALGASLSAAVTSEEDIPPFDNSAMDGFAVRSADVASASSNEPAVLRVTETIAAGDYPRRPVQSGEAVRIMTGAPLPPGADAVVQVERTREEGDRVSVLEAVPSGTNIRRAGEDIRTGDSVLPAGAELTAPEIGLLASLGFACVPVHRRPRVAIVATGSELVEPGEPLGKGQIRNSNSYALEAACREIGIAADRLGIAPDEYEATRRLLEKGLEYDVLITSGGVSVGEFDFVKQVLLDLGVEQHLWKVAIKPGKPLAFGTRDGTLVFGAPGNPVAVLVSFEMFIRPALLRLMGRSRYLRPLRRAVLEEGVRNRHGRVHVMRVLAREEGGRWHVRPTGPQGSGILRSMSLANGLAFVPMDRERLEAGEEIDLMLLREPQTSPPDHVEAD